MSTTATWVVTGAHGFLGANLGACLHGSVHRVGAVRTASDPDDLFDRYVHLDLEHPDSLLQFIEQERPDVVVHAAGLTSHEACEADPSLAARLNARSSGLLAEAATRAGSHFVLISTDAVFDGVRGHYTEDAETSPTSVYGRTKLEAERLVSRAADALIVRTNFFGWSPSGRRSILEFFVNELSAGRPVRGFTDFTTTSAYAQVLAETIWSLVQGGDTGVFHVTSPDALTKYDFGVAVAEVFGLPADLITPAIADIHPPRNGDLSLDVTKVEERLEQALPTQLAGIRRAFADAGTLRRTVTTGTGL